MIVLLFVILLGAGLVAIGLWLGVHGLRLRSWPTAPGRILEKQVTRDGPSGDDPYFFVAKLRYRYTVDGRELEGERIYRGHFHSFEPEMRAFVEALPAELPVHYRRSDPQDAFLFFDSLQWAALALACGAALMFIGLAARYGG